MELKIDPHKVKEARLGKSWSQEELAEHAGVSLRTIQRMELDGSASLKSRRSVAEALGVEPGDLDRSEPANPSPYPGPEERKESDQGLWSMLFAYPGPTSISSKIRTPLLVVLWVGMIVSGGPFILILVSALILGFVDPATPYQQLILASLPLFVVFLISFSLYHFFRKFSSPSPSQ